MRVRVRDGHPLTRGVKDFELIDELYYDLVLAADLRATEHADCEWEGRSHPMALSATGGRVEGAGKLVYLANGHDMRAFESPALRRLWVNAVHWCLEG
jgi:type 1 glutamine amidotransferase